MTRQEELVQAAREEYPEWEEAQCHYIDGAHYADSHPHWISVDDELPKINPNDSEWEYSDDVIVALKDGSIAVGRYERDNSTGEHYWMLYGVDKDLIVTHWMPLPSIEGIKGNQKKTSPNSNSISIDVFEEATKGFKPYPLFSERIEKASKSDHIADVSKKVKKGGGE